MDNYKPFRVEILQQVQELLKGDRQKTHGDPVIQLSTLAFLIDRYLAHNKRSSLDNLDAANIMILTKVSRMTHNRNHLDHYVDIAGYAAIAAECLHFRGMPPENPDEVAQKLNDILEVNNVN